MSRIPIALQLYSVREDCAKDFKGTIAAVAEMGYEGVEFAGYYNTPAAELKEWLDGLNIKCAGTHTGIDTLRGDQLAQTVEFNQTLGNPYLIVPGLPGEYYESVDKWREFVAEIADIADKVKSENMVVGYHNHWAEFNVFEGKTLMQILLDETPDNVSAQFDIGNALHGGGDALPLLQKYSHRALTIHLKENSSSDPTAVIGDGDVDWPAVFNAAESGATKWYIVEQEKYPASPLETVQRCLDNLKKWGK